VSVPFTIVADSIHTIAVTVENALKWLDAGWLYTPGNVLVDLILHLVPIRILSLMCRASCIAKPGGNMEALLVDKVRCYHGKFRFPYVLAAVVVVSLVLSPHDIWRAKSVDATQTVPRLALGESDVTLKLPLASNSGINSHTVESGLVSKSERAGMLETFFSEMEFVKLTAVDGDVRMAIPNVARTRAGYLAGNVQDYIRENGMWAPLSTQILKRALHGACARDSSAYTVLDIGSNTGYFSIVSLVSGCKVLAVDGTREHFNYLRLSALAMGRSENLTILHSLISDRQGTEHFNGWSAVESNRGDTMVNTITMDSLVKNDMHFIKIDIEGHEAKAISGMQEALRMKRLPCILIEYSFVQGGRDAMQEVIFETMLQKNYKIFHLGETTLVDISANAIELSRSWVSNCLGAKHYSCGADVLFLKNEAAYLARFADLM
jgi:FkbM family methyltransferase